MPLPSFLQRFRQGAQEPASGAVPMSSADIEQARVRARRRLVGMVVLVVAGVIAVTFPIAFYPNTYTVWFGVDLFIRRPSEEDLSEAERAVQG